MGIERFFNSLKNIYGPIITPLNHKLSFPNKYLLIDFNAIIHTISMSVSNSIIFLYHIYLISNIMPDVYKTHKQQIDIHINALKTSTKYIIEGKLNLPDQVTESNLYKYYKKIDMSELKIDIIDDSFFRLFNETILDDLIIYKISEYVLFLVEKFPQLHTLYLAIDGVPLLTKIFEQRNRRFMGHIIDNVKEKLLDYYKLELNSMPSLLDGIYYNHYEFEQTIKTFKFRKGKISPATTFMTKLEHFIFDFIKKKYLLIDVIVDSYNNFGEGERKIVNKIHEISKTKKGKETDEIIVSSPDADMILLMLLELDKYKIKIFRHDAQQQDISIIDINKLKNILLEHIKSNNLDEDTKQEIIKNIVILFSMFGNDFLPKIENINPNEHVAKILDAFISLKTTSKLNLIFNKNQDNKTYNINYELLKQFFINFNKNFNKPQNEYKKIIKTWKIEPNQIVNTSAIQYYSHIFDIENLNNKYDPYNYKNKIEHNKTNNTIITRKYIQGYIWLVKYYLEYNDDFILFKYVYDAPKLEDIINQLDLIIKNKKILDKIERNLEKTKIEMGRYLTPIKQLIYISPNNIDDIADKTYLTEDIIKLNKIYNEKYNKSTNIEINSGLVNLFDLLNCNNTIYLSKCRNKIKHPPIDMFIQN